MYDMWVTSGRKELALIAAFSLIAAARVFVFSAAFPFFNNVDEQAHVDLVGKYARGYWPRQPVETYDEESGMLFARYGTYEYLVPLERFAGNVAPPPPWKRTPATPDSMLQREALNWARISNFEAHAPPVYYGVAGAWHRVWGLIGLDDGDRLYFMRFMNVPATVLLVWLAYWLCLYGYPGRPELRFGVPMLIAFLPQDLFYSVNSDVLSAPLFTLSLVLMLLWSERASGAGLGALAGLVVGLTFLVKYTNVAVGVIFGLVVLKRFHALRGKGGWRDAMRSAGPAVLGALLPVAFCLGRNRILLGDWLGTAAKVEQLGWSARPLAAFFDHPLLTPAGLWTFWEGLMTTFWRGEFVWHLKPLAHGLMDGFYAISSAVLLSAAGALLLFRRSGAGRPPISTLLWLSCLISLACLALLSMAFDFGNSFYPSREHPFFTSGRLVSGMLVPFLVLYVNGAASLLRPPTRVPATLIVTAVICVMMLLSEIVLTLPIFENPYNWFHLD
jgi:hypothetical protein